MFPMFRDCSFLSTYFTYPILFDIKLVVDICRVNFTRRGNDIIEKDNAYIYPILYHKHVHFIN